MPIEIKLLSSPGWEDYELVDSGNGAKLERFGPYTFARPDHQAVWRPAKTEKVWGAAHGIFHPTGEESGGRWEFKKPVPAAWQMHYKGLALWARTGGSRHLGIFPEQAAHWDWIEGQVRAAQQPVRVLNLFGYTGVATLAAARAGAQVTHVDASKKTVAQARENQALSGLDDRPIRWIVDDALKFIRREARRNAFYEGLILDPPKFGRGPKGEVWELFEALPSLLDECRAILSKSLKFVVFTAYAIRASALTIHYALDEMVSDRRGNQETGELVTVERSAGRMLSNAIYTRWANEAAGEQE